MYQRHRLTLYQHLKTRFLSLLSPSRARRPLASECSLQPNKPLQVSDQGNTKIRQRRSLLRATFCLSSPRCRRTLLWMYKKWYRRGLLKPLQRRIRTILGMHHHFLAMCFSADSQIIGFILLLLSRPAARYPGKTSRRVLRRMRKCTGSSSIAGFKGIGIIGELVSAYSFNKF